MSFETLGLSPALLRALADQGYTAPTAIQSAAIPSPWPAATCSPAPKPAPARPPRSPCPCSSACFRTASAHRRQVRKPRALILTPTRELAAQVHDAVRDYGKHLRVNSAAIFGGVGMGPQMQALRRGVEILVATPAV
jgi:ATP-dependent RNA helicase RhlE